MAKYRGIVVDKKGGILLKENGMPYFSNIVDGKQRPDFWPYEWPWAIREKADRVDEELRVEINKKGSKKKEWKAEIEMELLKKGEERIAAAREMQNLAQMPAPEMKDMPESKTEEKSSSVEQKPHNAPYEAAETMSFGVSEPNAETLKDYSTSAAKKEGQATVDLSEVTACVENNAKQISEDLAASVDDLLEDYHKNSDENTEALKSYIEAQSKRICDAAKEVSQKTQKDAENIVKRVNENGRDIGETQDKLLSRIHTVGKRVTELGESVEGIEGNLHRLDQLDEITELLRDKGLTMSRDIPPVNADEEDIINLVRYSQKITEQLGYAARDLLRKQEAFKSQEENNANEQRVMEQRIAKAHEAGVEEGKKGFIKQLLSKYTDVDAIRESENEHVHVIWTLLTELGVAVDGEGYYEKGREVELADSDIEKMMGTYSRLEDAGRYRVTRTGLCFRGEILCKAAFEKVVETAGAEMPKDEGRPEAASEETK